MRLLEQSENTNALKTAHGERSNEIKEILGDVLMAHGYEGNLIRHLIVRGHEFRWIPQECPYYQVRQSAPADKLYILLKASQDAADAASKKKTKSRKKTTV
jgi:hypothetical protein